MTGNLNEFVNLKPGSASKHRADLPDETGDHVTILMATYNGASTLAEQLMSLFHQSHRNWSLVVSDDVSSDNTLNVLQDYARKYGAHRMALQSGPRQGFAQNFLSLLRAAGPTTPFAALCDQDDVWLPGKLERALSMLNRVPHGTPALYAGRTTICDSTLNPLRLSPLFARPPSFRNALVQSIGGGNTMVVNRAALDILQESSIKARRIVSHDWWMYQMVSGAAGRVIYDPQPMLLYRQHPGNIIGANDTLRASAHRLLQLVRGRFRNWNEANLETLNAARHWLSPAARETLDHFINARASRLPDRLVMQYRSGIYRQTKLGNTALWLATLIARL